MSNFPDMLYHMNGVPVTNTNWFAGWWGRDIYFVDYDNGSDGNTGKSIDQPLKYLDTALSAVSADDTIYVRPRDFSAEDPQAQSPLLAVNYTIATADHGVAIIGTGKGLGHAAAHQTFLTGYSALTTAIIRVNAPGCVIENIRSQPGTSTKGIIFTRNDGTYDGGNLTVVNCDFHDGSASGGAIYCDSTWQMSIVGNRFVNCDIGVYIDAIYSAPQIFQVWNNTFVAIDSEVSADVYASGAVKRFLSYNNYHASGLPTTGHARYYKFGAASTGMIANCFFGEYDTTPTDAELFTLNGVKQAGNYACQYLVTSAA